MSRSIQRAKVQGRRSGFDRNWQILLLHGAYIEKRTLIPSTAVAVVAVIIVIHDPFGCELKFNQS